GRRDARGCRRGRSRPSPRSRRDRPSSRGTVPTAGCRGPSSRRRPAARGRGGCAACGGRSAGSARSSRSACRPSRTGRWRAPRRKVTLGGTSDMHNSETVLARWVAHRVVPGLPWASAFALGAVVSPPDVAAATAFVRRLPLPRRLVTILEGESMVNDAAAIVAYRMAVAAAVTGTFSLATAGARFLLVGAGGVAVGLAVGWLIGQVRRHIHDPEVANTISLLPGSAAYMPAEHLGVSGILAVVATGLYLGRV